MFMFDIASNDFRGSQRLIEVLTKISMGKTCRTSLWYTEKRFPQSNLSLHHIQPRTSIFMKLDGSDGAETGT